MIRQFKDIGFLDPPTLHHLRLEYPQPGHIRPDYLELLRHQSNHRNNLHLKFDRLVHLTQSRIQAGRCRD